MSQAITHPNHDGLEFTSSDGQHVVIHQVELSAIGKWLRQGWIDMAHSPSGSLFYGLLMTFFVLLVLVSYRETPYLMFTLATSFILISPFLATGLYDIAHSVEQGKEPDLIHSMTAWKENLSEIALYAVSLGVLIAVWTRVAGLIAAIAVSQSGLLIVNPEEGVISLLQSEAGMNFMLAYFLIGGVFALFVFAISVVTIPLMLKNKQFGAVSAMIVSFKVVLKNIGVMALWAFIIASLVAIGLVTAGMGMIVVMPLLGYASWHAFTDLVEVDSEQKNVA